jgi:hypothetical protein
LKPHILASSLLLVAMPALSYTGTAYFSASINWSTTGNLYFTVTGGPPNTCGDLYTIRNGQVVGAAGWLCTDANGNAFKGPWTWANTPGDQTDVDLRINWPGGDSTNLLTHIWDKTCPTIVVTSPTGTPPSTHSGRIDDGAWGAGLNQAWTEMAGYFRQVETNTFWRPGDTSYSRPYPGPVAVAATTSGWPSPGQTDLSIDWSFSQIPPPSAHVSGYHYEWGVEAVDADRNCIPITTTRTFTAP